MDEQILINRLSVVIASMQRKPPYDSQPVALSLGDLTMIVKALALLAAVRLAAK